MSSVALARSDFSDWRKGGVCSTRPERGAYFQRLVFSPALHKGTHSSRDFSLDVRQNPPESRGTGVFEVPGTNRDLQLC